jgi:predicted ABC-type ATPase
MSDAPNQDRMSPEDYRDAYADARRDAFEGTVPRDGAGEQPRAIVLAGQPGAGKGRITDQAKAELDREGGAVVIDPDKLREYHQRDGEPDYAAMAREDYRNAATRVHPDASQMSKDLRADAIAEQRNLIIDGTLNDPDKAENCAGI